MQWCADTTQHSKRADGCVQHKPRVPASPCEKNPELEVCNIWIQSDRGMSVLILLEWWNDHGEKLLTGIVCWYRKKSLRFWNVESGSRLVISDPLMENAGSTLILSSGPLQPTDPISSPYLAWAAVPKASELRYHWGFRSHSLCSDEVCTVGCCLFPFFFLSFVAMHPQKE